MIGGDTLKWGQETYPFPLHLMFAVQRREKRVNTLNVPLCHRPQRAYIKKKNTYTYKFDFIMLNIMLFYVLMFFYGLLLF